VRSQCVRIVELGDVPASMAFPTFASAIAAVDEHVGARRFAGG
jgi:hypothetical protein